MFTSIDGNWLHVNIKPWAPFKSWTRASILKTYYCGIGDDSYEMNANSYQLLDKFVSSPLPIP